MTSTAHIWDEWADETGSIGKRYRRQDEIGTPFCITVDFDTVGDEAKVSQLTTASPSATVIPWSRCVCPSPSSRAISRARSSSDPNKNSPAVAISAGLWYIIDKESAVRQTVSTFLANQLKK